MFTSRSMGMIGIVVVGGNTSNMDAIKSQKVTGSKSKKKEINYLVKFKL